MIPVSITKEKIIAVLTVLFLFLLVGTLFLSISLNSKRRTDELRNLVRQQKIDAVNKAKLEGVNLILATSTGITAKSFITLAVADNGLKKILNQKNADLILPIASITKLMVAVIAKENVNLEENILATPDYIGLEESAFILETSKTYKAKDLLFNALISSDNDSARLLGSALGENNFVAKMNLKAQGLGMASTSFVNITGLDPVVPSGRLNTSTANDLVRLISYIQSRYPEILRVTTQSLYNFCDVNNYCKQVASTNKLLDDENFKLKIMGGKTGYTDLAGKNLVLVVGLLDDVSIINIVLGSEDNFADTLSLISQIKINQ